MDEAVQHKITEPQPYCRCAASTGMPYQEESCNESSTHSTPFVSAPSSPTRKSTPLGFYLARPTLTIPASPEAHDGPVVDDAVSADTEVESTSPSSPALSEFEFSSRFSEADVWFSPSSKAPPMSTAEELFHNGKIRPLNTRLCPSSYCICFSDPIHHEGYDHDRHFYETCHSCAYRDCTRSAHAEHHHHHRQQQYPLMRKQRSGHTKPTSAFSALEQWKKSMGRYEMKGHSRHASGHHVERVMQIPSLPLPGGHHRRSRSLSHLRVFHMDDMMMQARASFENENILHTDNEISHAVDVGTIMRPRRSRKSWTLTELLAMGDNKVHDKRPQLQGNFIHVELSSFHYEDTKYAPDSQAQASGVECEKFGSKEFDVCLKNDKVHNVGKPSFVEERLYSCRSSTHQHEGARSSWNLQKPMEEHADQYYSIGSQSAQVEGMKRSCFLPYKKGLLGCLGFTSKLSSIKGSLHAMKG